MKIDVFLRKMNSLFITYYTVRSIDPATPEAIFAAMKYF